MRERRVVAGPGDVDPTPGGGDDVNHLGLGAVVPRNVLRQVETRLLRTKFGDEEKRKPEFEQSENKRKSSATQQL